MKNTTKKVIGKVSNYGTYVLGGVAIGAIGGLATIGLAVVFGKAIAITVVGAFAIGCAEAVAMEKLIDSCYGDDVEELVLGKLETV